MFWKWFWKSLAFLLILSIFLAGGIAIYKAGYAQGVNAALWSVEPGSDSAVPYPIPYYRPLVLLPFTGMFFFFICLLLLFGGFRRHSHYRMWKSAGMPDPEEIRHHWSSVNRKHHPAHWSSAKDPSKEKPDGSKSVEEQPVDAGPES